MPKSERAAAFAELSGENSSERPIDREGRSSICVHEAFAVAKASPPQKRGTSALARG